MRGILKWSYLAPNQAPNARLGETLKIYQLHSSSRRGSYDTLDNHVFHDIGSRLWPCSITTMPSEGLGHTNETSRDHQARGFLDTVTINYEKLLRGFHYSRQRK